LIKPTSLLFKDPTVQMQLHFEFPAQPPGTPGCPGTSAPVAAACTGRARVAVQSAYEPMEDNGRLDHQPLKRDAAAVVRGEG